MRFYILNTDNFGTAVITLDCLYVNEYVLSKSADSVNLARFSYDTNLTIY